MKIAADHIRAVDRDWVPCAYLDSRRSGIQLKADAGHLSV